MWTGGEQRDGTTSWKRTALGRQVARHLLDDMNKWIRPRFEAMLDAEDR